MSSIVDSSAIHPQPSTVPTSQSSISEPLQPDTGISSHAGAGFFCEQLRSRGLSTTGVPRILIAGCGAGHEAVAIQECLQAEVEAVDVEDVVEPHLRCSKGVHFRVASVCELPFAEASFDAIFYHHVIEHVDKPAASLRELSRVLAPRGWLFIGTPNRHRAFSSIGAHRQSQWEATLANKWADNVRDWKHRMTGRFRNELGAHAGFSRRELDEMLADHFQERHWLTDEYLRYKYSSGRVASLIPLATHPAICWFSAPAIYVLCRKAA